MAARALGQDERLADVVALAASTFDAPMAAVVSRHGDRSSVQAEYGLGRRGPLPREHLFVRTLEQHTPLLVLPDIQASPDFPARFYVGVALHSRTGTPLGTLVACATEPRNQPTPAQLATFIQLGRIAAALLEQHQIERRALIVTQAGEQAREAVLIGDRHGNVRWHNRAAQRLFGPQLLGQSMSPLFPLHLQPDREQVRSWLDGDIEGSMTLRIQTPDGNPCLLDATRSCWRHGNDYGITLILHDITDAAAQRAQLDRLAHYDPLTGLPNRNALLAALETHSHWGVALIAIDRFKWINDGLGHAVGDSVLKAFSQRLQELGGEQTCVARVGGDVFALACSDNRLATGKDEDENFLPAIIRQMEQPLLVHGHQLNVDVSTGVALRADVLGGGDLLACADLALNRAKSAGGHQTCRYTPSMRTQALTRRDLDLDLRRAFAQGDLEVHYQPQVELHSGRICGAEALLRWRHPLRGMVPAGDFIDLLAHSPLGVDVGAWVLQQACLTAAKWPDTMVVSVNLFPTQLGEALVPQVEEALTAAGLPAERLELEITETIALTRNSIGAKALSTLRSRGVSLAFDDFGTGYASLSMLQRFRIDRIKIDRSFVEGMLRNSEDASIVRWILMLSRALGLRVVAEGVEEVAQAEWLHHHGCEEAQGYLYAQALDADTLQKRLLEQQTEMPDG